MPEGVEPRLPRECLIRSPHPVVRSVCISVSGLDRGVAHDGSDCLNVCPVAEEMGANRVADEVSEWCPLLVDTSSDEDLTNIHTGSHNGSDFSPLVWEQTLLGVEMTTEVVDDFL